MELIEENNKINDKDLFDKFKNPEEIRAKIHALQEQLPVILEDFKKYFVFYNKNPEYPEYQQMFENIKSNLNKINSQLFTLSNEINFNTEEINKKMFALNVLIRKEKEKNKELKKKLKFVEHKNNASTELISDYKKMYDYGYLRNWGLILSIIISIVFIKNVYKKQ
jgi:DNA repair ATPase RecN